MIFLYGWLALLGGLLVFGVIYDLTGRNAPREITIYESLSQEDRDYLDDLFVMEDLSEDPGWIRDGIESLSIYATWKQHGDGEVAA